MTRGVCALGLAIVLALQYNTAMPALARDQAAVENAGVQSLIQRLKTSSNIGPVITEREFIAALQAVSLTKSEADALWDFASDPENAAWLSLASVKALVQASQSPAARELMWGELSGLALAQKSPSRTTQPQLTLLRMFETHREELQALLAQSAETQDAGDDMTGLMLKSRVFGASLDDSVREVSRRAPAAVARYIERERGLGRPVKWEYVAFEKMNAWKIATLPPGAPQSPRTLAELDAAGAMFVTVFNCMHWLDDGFREILLRGLGPVELFNAVVGGEKELYRLGTSSYREFLHIAILAGIKDAGSFEAFLARATPHRFGAEAASAQSHRAMVFLRVASAFGVLDDIIATVADRNRFVAAIIASLDDPRAFEDNSVVTMDVLTAKPEAGVSDGFKRALLDGLYERYASEQRPAQQSVFGSLLSVYQSLSGDRRRADIDRAYPLDNVAFALPYDRVFAREGGRDVHRMFMRMDASSHDAATYTAFRILMRKLGAKVEAERFFDLFTVSKDGKTIEIYANAPSPIGITQGVANIAAALQGRRLDTVIGRGHTTIVAPLQSDARRIAGPRVKEVSLVVLGTCGGDASVRPMIATFGYVPYIATKSTGRQYLNEALIKSYVAALLSLTRDAQIEVPRVLDGAMARYAKPGADPGLRDDALHYQVSRATVLTARLFDSHVRRHTGISFAGSEP